MKTKLLLPSIHSFIDVITNSSSELFVVESAKSIETVEEMLKIMLNYWNSMAADGIFGSRFVKNERYSISNDDKIKSPPLKPYNEVFGAVYVYTKEMYEHDKKEFDKYKKEYPNDKIDPGWGYEKSSNIGKIMITSSDDNSIPYEMFEWIESAFGHVKRFHLG